MESKDVYLDSIKNRIEAGEFDDQFTLPFMTRKLMYATIKGKLNNRAEAGKTPVLSDSELKLTIEDMKEASASTFALFIKFGILEKSADGLGFQLSDKGKKAIFQSSKL